MRSQLRPAPRVPCALRRLRRLAPTLAALALLVTAAGCGRASSGLDASPTSSVGAVPAASSPLPSSVSTAATGGKVAHVVRIVLENKSASEIIGGHDAPFINALARRSGYASDYSALFHPSLPNYIALTSGSNQGITDDRSPPTAGYAVSAVNLADRIDASGRTWKSYAESIPSPGFASGDTSLYATRHVPFLYYTDILDDAQRRITHVVPFTDLPQDFGSASTTPDFSFVTPNLYDDMHDGPVSAGDSWLARWVPVILASPAFKEAPSLLVITWDEGTGSDQKVATILAGSAVKARYRSGRPYDHYSLLHTIETVWGLRPMTANDAGAATMEEFLR